MIYLSAIKFLFGHSMKTMIYYQYLKNKYIIIKSKKNKDKKKNVLPLFW